MNAHLRRELLSAKGRLSGLIKDTETAIGKIAGSSYTALQKFPPAPGYPLNTTNSSGTRPLSPALRAQRIIRVTALPTRRPIQLQGRNGFLVTQVSTEDLRIAGIHHIGDRRLPAHSKYVNASLKKVPLGVLQTLSVSDHGYALYGRDYFLFPSVTDESIMHDKPEYSSAQELRAAYAGLYTGALLVTDLVAMSLRSVYDIESNTAPLARLINKWQEIKPPGSPSIDEGLARAIPEGLLVL